MSGSPSGPGTVRSSLTTLGFSGISMPLSIASTVARRCTMSGTELKPPGMASSSMVSGTATSASISSRRDTVNPNLGSEGETHVALGGHVVALLAVLTHAAAVGHEDAGLAGHVGAHVPGVRARIERVAGQQVDVVDPLVLGRRGGLDRAQPLLFEVGDGVGDPVHVL